MEHPYFVGVSMGMYVCVYVYVYVFVLEVYIFSYYSGLFPLPKLSFPAAPYNVRLVETAEGKVVATSRGSQRYSQVSLDSGMPLGMFSSWDEQCYLLNLVLL